MSVCHGCPRRSKPGEPNCHMTCPDYAAEQAENAQKSKARRKAAAQDDYFINYMHDAADKNRVGSKQKRLKRRH